MKPLLVVICAGLAAAQSPKFEVASIKPNGSEVVRGAIMGMKVQPNGRVAITNLAVQMLISIAYDVPFQSTRLHGGPDWIRSERYDIEAAPSDGAIPAGSTARERDKIVQKMLQALLAERFHLLIERETKEQPVYVVTVGKKGVKLDKAGMDENACPLDEKTAKSCHNLRGGQGRGLHSDAATIEDAAAYVSNWSDRPVVDQTGIKTLFKFDTPGWIPMRLNPATGQPTSPEGLDDPLRPSLFGIFDQMGLKLEARKAPVESLRIASIEHPKE